MKVNRTVKASLILLLASIFIISPLIFNRTAILGVDGYFHYNRIYETAMQLRNHNLSFLNLYSFQQAGRIVNQVYSPLLTYLFGALLLLAGNWMRFQVLSSVLVSFVSGFTTYHAARRLKLQFKTSVALGILYMTSLSMIGFIYSISWRATALAFVPLLVGPMIDFYQGDWSIKSMLSLGLIVGITTQAQIMTAATALPALLPFFVMGLMKSKQKLVSLGNLLIAILLALVLSLNVILPYLDINHNTTMLPPTALPLINGISNVIVPFVNNSDSLTVTITCIIFYLGLSGLILYWKRTSTFSKTLLIVAMIYVVLGTNLVPWAVIDKMMPLLEHFLQLPRRFTIVGLSLLFLGCASLFHDLAIESHRDTLHTAIDFTSITFAAVSAVSLAVALAGTVAFYRNPNTNLASGLRTGPNNVHGKTYRGKPVRTIVDIQPAFHTRHLSDLIRIVDRTTPDYVPTVRDGRPYSAYQEYNQRVIGPKHLFKHKVQPNALELTWTSNRRKTVEVPVVAYGSTQLTLNGHKLTSADYHRSIIGTITLNQTHQHNVLRLTYHTRTVTKIGIIMSILAWILAGFAGLGLFIQAHRRKHTTN